MPRACGEKAVLHIRNGNCLLYTSPRTVVVATDYFDQFVRDNGLMYVINADVGDEEILSEFVSSRLPETLVNDLRAYIRTVSGPLAIRSSSKLEDSHYQPFAGIYSTYMIPKTDNEDQMLRLLGKAVKSVYASVYFAASRAYIQASSNLLSEEKMAVVIPVSYTHLDVYKRQDQYDPCDAAAATRPPGGHPAAG